LRDCGVGEIAKTTIETTWRRTGSKRRQNGDYKQSNERDCEECLPWNQAVHETGVRGHLFILCHAPTIGGQFRNSSVATGSEFAGGGSRIDKNPAPVFLRGQQRME